MNVKIAVLLGAGGDVDTIDHGIGAGIVVVFAVMIIMSRSGDDKGRNCRRVRRSAWRRYRR